MTAAALQVESLRGRAVNVPIVPPLRTGSGTITSCPLVLIDVATSAGVVGRSYIFAYTTRCLGALARLIQDMGDLLVDHDPAPLAVAARLDQSFRLVGTGGLVAMALGGIDMALWDACARAAGWPLARLLGAAPRPVPAYWNVGMCGAEEAARAAEQALAHGCRALKIKVGHPDLADDLAAIRAIRAAAAGQGLQVMVDYNQSLSVPEARRRIRRLEDEQLTWIEEPTLAADVAGHAALAREAHTPIQLGENWSSLREMGASLAAGASDLAMVDAMKIGGVTGWMRAAALAEVHGLPVSSHLFPEISAHLLAATPTAHWLELLDLAAAVLVRPARVEGGMVTASDEPGTGIEWNEAAVHQYACSAG
jgi:mandelate racemase